MLIAQGCSIFNKVWSIIQVPNVPSNHHWCNIWTLLCIGKIRALVHWQSKIFLDIIWSLLLDGTVCLAKCVHVIKTGCRPLPLSLLRAGTLVLAADQQPSRNKKLHRSKNRANPAFNGCALVGQPSAGLASHWAHTIMWLGPIRLFASCRLFLQIIHPERRGSVSLHGRSYRTGDANRMCAKEVKVASISGQIFAKQRLNGATCPRSEPGVTFRILLGLAKYLRSQQKAEFCKFLASLQIFDVENLLLFPASTSSVWEQDHLVCVKFRCKTGYSVLS